jgi:rhodanese-related sulfurtransferase
MFIDDTKNSDDWMAALLKSPIFQCLPPTRLQEIIMSLEDVDFIKGDVILEQGSTGDYYYIIKNGQCICTRKSSPNAKAIKLRQLTTGDTFGEDALLSGAPRDLTITALTDMSLLRLDKQQFISLIKEPSLTFVDFIEMQEAIKQGAILMDVRPPDEYEKYHLDGSINQPFFSLRMQLKTLDHKKSFIVICADGRISEAAAFLLRKNKIDATILKGGMASITPESKNDDIETIADHPENSHQADETDHSASATRSHLKSVFFQHFEQSVDDCCRQIEIEFGFQLGRNREKMSKDQYIKLLEYLRSVREDIKQHYLTKVNDIFNESYQKTASDQTEQLDFSEISLMSGDAVEENHAITTIIRQCEHLFYEELTRLNRLFAIQSGKQVIARNQNPILPEKLIYALIEVVKPLKLNTDSRIALYKTFDVNVFSQLGFIYRELLIAEPPA